MKLSQLIERLEEIRDDLRDGLGDEIDPVVIAATQPGYPLSGEILGATALDEEDDDEPILLDGVPVVWIAVGNHPHGLSPYAPSRIYEVLP